MNKVYNIAGHRFGVSGERLCRAIGKIAGFEMFESEPGTVAFVFEENDAVPTMVNEQYSLEYEDIIGVFGRTSDGFMLRLKPSAEEALYLWTVAGRETIGICGNLSARLLRFALWVGYGLMTLPRETVAIHSSCIVRHNRAVLFLGESGTGKSTHTQLWRKHVDGAFLLNDDSPVIRIEGGVVKVYGSPWSGKTPCYRQESYELAACVRLSQAPYNRIMRLPALRAYAALHPSCPPEFAYDSCLYDFISGFIEKVICSVPVFRMECLPDEDAALLACRTIFNMPL